MSALTSEERRVLEARAELLARPAEATEEAGDEAVVVRVAATRFAVRLDALVTLVRLPRLTPLPGAPPWIAGLAALRGRARCVVDLGLALGMARSEAALALLVSQGGGLTAFAVDELVALRPIRAAELAPPPSPLGPAAAPFVAGVTADGTTLLELGDLAASLADQPGSDPP